MLLNRQENSSQKLVQLIAIVFVGLEASLLDGLLHLRLPKVLIPVNVRNTARTFLDLVILFDLLVTVRDDLLHEEFENKSACIITRETLLAISHHHFEKFLTTAFEKLRAGEEALYHVATLANVVWSV